MRWLTPLLTAWLVLVALMPAGEAASRQVQIVTSPGGLTAWLVHEPQVPVISLRLAFKGGGALDPEGKEGLANLVSGLLDEGAGELDALAFQTRVEELALKLSFSADRDFFYGSFTTLSRNRDAGFELLRLALSQPRFDPEPVERVRRQVVVNLTGDLEEPGTVAGRDWFKAVFGPHPYWHSTEGAIEGIQAIGRADLAGFVKRHFVRKHLMLGVVGDITAAELGPLLDRTFGGLPAEGSSFELPQVSLDLDDSIKVIRRPIPQSTIFFGMPGLQRDDPDWYVADLMTYVLGRGQSSRLYMAVREQRGLAYSVYGYLLPLERTGLILGGAGTRNEKVAESLATIKAEIARLRDEGISEDELADAKTYINGSFPLRQTSSGSIASLLLSMQMHGLGTDYLERRPEIYSRITREDVARVAKRLLQPERLRVVIVGDPVGFD